jgi:IS5 family transposase
MCSKRTFFGIMIHIEEKENRSKRVPGKQVYAVTKKRFKAGKVLVTTIQRVNLKMLCTAFFIISIY